MLVKNVATLPRNVTSVSIQSLLLGVPSYLFLFRNTRFSMHLGSRHERHLAMAQSTTSCRKQMFGSCRQCWNRD